jgi:hypothetical protein
VTRPTAGRTRRNDTFIVDTLSDNFKKENPIAAGFAADSGQDQRLYLTQRQNINIGKQRVWSRKHTINLTDAPVYTPNPVAQHTPWEGVRNAVRQAVFKQPPLPTKQPAPHGGLPPVGYSVKVGQAFDSIAPKTPMQTSSNSLTAVLKRQLQKAAAATV